MTRPYAEVIGDPIAHSKSPLIHNFWLAKLGIDAEYRTCHVRPEELADYFAQRRGDAQWRGCNVTIPHKERVADFLDAVDARTTKVGAVNTVYRDEDGSLIGANTDIDGVAEAIGDLDLTGQEVCVIGAGGAARAAFQFLSKQRCAAVLVLARNPEKALGVASELSLMAVGVPLNAGSSALCEASLLINATQLGMTGQESMPGFVLDELTDLAEGALVFDMVYSPLETELLASARRLGFRTAGGLTMLVGQAAVAFEKFFGQPAPRQHDAELRALLTK
jgi:shikimate dehydrogenase